MAAPPKPVPVLVTLFDEDWERIVDACKRYGLSAQADTITKRIEEQRPRGKR